MPTTYSDQFWIIDPFAPPSAGTTLTVQNYDLVDQDDDGDVGRYGNDSVNGSDVTNGFPGDTVTVELDDGSTVTITGTTLYLANGSVIFTPTDGSVLEDATFVSSTYVTSSGVLDVSTLGPTCLTQGTLVETESGARPVDELREGDVILAADGRHLVLRQVLSVSFQQADMARNPRLKPVRIVAGALGNGLPHRDLLVSRQHRMLLDAKAVRRMFGCDEVLIPAIKLTELPGIFVDGSTEYVEYFHLVFDAHEVIVAEGAPTESFYAGVEALRSLPRSSLSNMMSQWPDLVLEDGTLEPARMIPTDKLQKNLVARLARNGQLPVQAR
jgi:hypothetical protein